ncbi:MAG: hypothetical protein E7166_01525 [Firmicutes bacterium]|nr:hypothetical protein [Bacillota bacterium]
MKKMFLFIVMFFLGITSVNAYIVMDNIEISEDRTKYYISGSTLTRPSLADKEKFVFDEQNVVNYINKIEDFIEPYYSNVFYDGGMDDDGKLSTISSLIPAELLSSHVFVGGGSSGSCRLVNGEIDCNSRDNPVNWDRAQQINSRYLREAYPILLDDLVSITRPDIYSPISFNNLSGTLPNSIISNGTLDSDGRWVSNNPIKIYESEYKKGKVELLTRGNNPYGLSGLYFSRDGFKYRETSLDTKNVYERLTEEQIDEACSKYEQTYQSICKRVTGNIFIGSLNTVPIDTKNKVIHGLWFTTFSGSNENIKINTARQTYGTRGFGAIYEFEIPIEVIPDVVEEKNDEKVLTGIQENNAKIYIDNKEVKIKNLKDYDLGRIYVSLEDVCKNIDTCNIEKKQNEKGKTFYRVTRKILNTEIEFSLIHYPETKTFETTVYKNNESLNFDIISPASGYIDAESKIIDNVLYVPIRFLLEGLGANISYVSSKGNEYPEEVHVSFNDNGDIKIESNTLEKDSNDKFKYISKTNKNYISFMSSFEGTKRFYAFQLEKNNAPVSKSDIEKYSNMIEFPEDDTYKYLIVNKTSNNGSEFMAYQIFTFEYKK